MKQSKKIDVVTKIGVTLVCATVLLGGGTSVLAGDTWPARDEAAIGKAQPHFSGYRVRDIEKWESETDPYSHMMKAQVPLQKRNTPFRETQANPELTSPVETMLMQGDYGNSFMESTIYNNDYGNLAFNFWQYTDLFSPWHGAATIGTPSSLYDPATSDWRKRGFEFGIVNIPNQAYINAAHKNGVKAIACVYFDPYFRPGQTKKEMFEKDGNGEYIIAQKLVELADYYGIDGYFLNDEESGADEFKELMTYLTGKGLYTQFYNTNSFFDQSKRSYLRDSQGNQIHNSVFVNYGWPSAPDRLLSQIEEGKKEGFDPYKEAFIGVEALQAGFKGGHPTSAVEKLYLKDSKNPMASIALFTPSDYYQRELDTDLKKEGDEGQFPLHQQEEYQWMIANRERMYFSGVHDDPRNTGRKPGASRAEVGVKDASKWAGVADFKAENSVIRGSKFYSTFNIGKGMAYYNKGKLTNESQWSNLNDQDILPTWQWWVEAEENRLKVDFDFGEKEQRKNTDRVSQETLYSQVGAYHGGSSLVTYGDISSENTIRLFKTALDIEKATTMSFTAKTPKVSEVSVSVGLIFEDQPEKIEKIAIPTNESTNWETKTISLEKYAGKKLATIAMVFDGNEKNYQYNLGEISYSNEETVPEAPKDVTINQIYETNEANISWQLDSYETVDKYRIYSTDKEGNRHSLGSIFGSDYYIKDTLSLGNDASIEVSAIGKDGKESKATTVQLAHSQMVSNLTVAEEMTTTNLYSQAKEAGKVHVSWESPKAFTPDAFEVTVQPLNTTGDQGNPFHLTVEGNQNEAVIETGLTEGLEYDLTVQSVKDGNVLPGISYRGKLHDSIAENISLADIKLSKDGNGIVLRSPLTQDWRHVRVKSSDKVVRALERGVTQNYDNVIKFGTANDKLIPLRIELEDYAGNVSKELVIGKNNENQLVELVSLQGSKLEELINQSKELLSEDKFTKESAEKLQSVFDAVNSKVETGYLIESEMNVLEQEIMKAIEELVEKIYPESIKTGLNSLTVLKVGDEIPIDISFSPEETNVRDVNYTIQKEGIVSIEENRLTALEVGMTRVTVETSNGKKENITIRVTP